MQAVLIKTLICEIWIKTSVTHHQMLLSKCMRLAIIVNGARELHDIISLCKHMTYQFTVNHSSSSRPEEHLMFSHSRDWQTLGKLCQPRTTPTWPITGRKEATGILEQNTPWVNSQLLRERCMCKTIGVCVCESVCVCVCVCVCECACESVRVCVPRVRVRVWQNLILPSATCSWINIVINQSDLKNKFIIFGKFRLTISVWCLYINVIHLSFPLILGITHD